MIFLAASCIFYLASNYILPACVPIDAVVDTLLCLASADPAPSSRSDLEIELKCVQLGSACPAFYVTA